MVKTKVLVVSGENGNGVKHFEEYNKVNHLDLVDWIKILENQNITQDYVDDDGCVFNVELYTFGDVDAGFIDLMRDTLQDDSEKNDLDFFVVYDYRG